MYMDDTEHSKKTVSSVMRQSVQRINMEEHMYIWDGMKKLID